VRSLARASLSEMNFPPPGKTPLRTMRADKAFREKKTRVKCGASFLVSHPREGEASFAVPGTTGYALLSGHILAQCAVAVIQSVSFVAAPPRSPHHQHSGAIGHPTRRTQTRSLNTMHQFIVGVPTLGYEAMT
jgi:hypothetical protein